MSRVLVETVDFIEELRLRRWARENYVAQSDRAGDWHPIILEEMSRKDQERLDACREDSTSTE
ncbi:hypothetical protein [Tuwongella immobilis]|uniref:Uncharacterized protein n=1 Tax=Tuwongella immobilis TaxID=692036 RepID=A0A6C2YR40_9BACT|nr:hypothetical protein [Tuwongella immobilis]VIP03455.1 Uncharacterized protein OS=Planctomyces maris DSM 8797 GN=PM8797T_11319 PE=4 SV=1 [Tuwongella immobilis]VTS04282.1 Uncharacterized protein OS=Planctomyces maris DSM 8797 GN=PM8797T_11319 PE=4 SV=1 [Tuwongella immobilis]